MVLVQLIEYIIYFNFISNNGKYISLGSQETASLKNRFLFNADENILKVEFTFFYLLKFLYASVMFD